MNINLTKKDIKNIIKSTDTEMQWLCKAITIRQKLKGKDEEMDKHYEKLDKEDKEYLEELKQLQEKLIRGVKNEE